MRRKMLVWFVGIAITFSCGVRFVHAQEETKEAQSKSAKPSAEEKRPAQPVQAYRLDFSLNELEDGKKANTRHYSMNLTSGKGDEVKIGTRVPVATGSYAPGSGAVNTQYQYIDVGTRIWSILRPRGDEFELEVSSEISNVDTESGQGEGPRLAPVVRQIKIEGSTILILGKPIVIGSVDDPNSKRQFQLEVTVTKLH